MHKKRSHFDGGWTEVLFCVEFSDNSNVEKYGGKLKVIHIIHTKIRKIVNISVFSVYFGCLGAYIDKMCEKVKKMSKWKMWSYPTYSH